jgi:hypothetical protein
MVHEGLRPAGLAGGVMADSPPVPNGPGKERPVEVDVDCPYCGEAVPLWVDDTAGKVQTYVEDCQVCCQPMDVTARFDGDEFDVRVARSDGGGGD